MAAPCSTRTSSRPTGLASGKADRHPLHTDFRLSAHGEQVDLRDASGREVNQPELPALGTDVSYGLGSDGRVGVLMTPTPGLPNSPIQAAH